VKAFLGVAKDPGRPVSDYANMCGVSNGAMSWRLNDLGEMYSRDRSLPGLGLLESMPDPMDRRYTLVKLSPEGQAFAARVARLVGKG
jgi:DNA-binding MarR family transcriptional regulator